MRYRYRSLLVSTGLLLILASTSAHAEALSGPVESALAAHPSIEAAQAAKKVAEEKESEERSDYFPTVSANVAGGRMFGDNSTSRGLNVTRGTAYSWLWEGSAQLNQPIFDGMETSHR